MFLKNKKIWQRFSSLRRTIIVWALLVFFTPKPLQESVTIIGFFIVLPLYIPYVLVENFQYFRKRKKINKVLHNPSSPFYKWNIYKMKAGNMFPWDEAIVCKPFSKKYLKKPVTLIHALSSPGFAVSGNDASLPNKRHFCINEEWICVFYTGNKSESKYKQQGILTICPECKKQLTFNGTSLN